MSRRALKPGEVDPDDMKFYAIPKVVREAACPACGEPKMRRCRTLATRRVTDTHVARFEAFWNRNSP